MERRTSNHEETGKESGSPLVADAGTESKESKEPGGDGEGSGASPTAMAGLLNDDALIPSGDKQSGHVDQHKSAASVDQTIRAFSSSRTATGSAKKKHRGLPAIDHFAGQGDPAMHPAVAPGMLPPLNIRSDTGRERQDPRAKDTFTFKTAAITAMSAGTIRNLRRSSDTMHVDLLRVFVPDMLINVSATTHS